MKPDVAAGPCFENFHNWTIMLKADRLCGNGDRNTDFFLVYLYIYVVYNMH